MLKKICLVLLLLGTASFVAAQSAAAVPGWELGLGYNYIRANQPPGQCACFSLNGGNASVAWVASPKFSLVGEFLGATNGNVNSSSLSLNLASYLVGPRYTYRRAGSRVVPFGQVLIGGAHASGGLYGTGNGYNGSSNGLAMTAGGGLDVNVSPHFAVRLLQADYLMTRLTNGVNDRQNSLSLSAGIVFRFGRH